MKTSILIGRISFRDSSCERLPNADLYPLQSLRKHLQPQWHLIVSKQDLENTLYQRITLQESAYKALELSLAYKGPHG